MSGASTPLGSASLSASLTASSTLSASSGSGLSSSASSFSAPASSEATGGDFCLVFGQGGDDGGVGSVGGPDAVGSVEDGYI